MRKTFLFVLSALCALSPCVASNLAAQNNRGPSTPEERTRALAAIDDLETNPLGPKAKDEREWLLLFLIQVPDIHVGICAGILPDLPKGNKKDSNVLTLQPTFSSARYAIEHNGGSSDSLDQYQVGIEGALLTYENLLKVRPDDRQQALDDLLKRRADGTLTAYVKDRVAKVCKK